MSSHGVIDIDCTFRGTAERLVDSGEYGDMPERGREDSGHNEFFNALWPAADKVPGSAKALMRAMQGKEPHPGDLKAMREVWGLIRGELVGKCEGLLWVRA